MDTRKGLLGISPKLDCTLPIDTKQLIGTSVLVTGGADGIGAGLVQALSEAGAYVTFADLNKDKGLALEKSLTEQGFKAKFVVADVTDWKSQVEAFKAAIMYSPDRAIDIVFPNAGIVQRSLLEWDSSKTPSLDIDPEEPSLKVYEVNLLAVAKTIKLATHYFKLPSTRDVPVGSKAIILTGSLVSYLESPLVETYGSSKFGVRGLFKAFRHTLIAQGVRINMVSPSHVRTSLVMPVIEAMEKEGIKFIDIEDVVQAMLRLACDRTVYGRSIGIGPGRTFDYGDDSHGHQGFLALQDQISSGDLGRSIEF